MKNIPIPLENVARRLLDSVLHYVNWLGKWLDSCLRWVSCSILIGKVEKANDLSIFMKIV